MAQVTTSLNRAAQQELGIEVVDVRVKASICPRGSTAACSSG